jgi:hypothetical protein
MKTKVLRIGWEWGAQLDAHREIIKEFASLDQCSFSFRYPVKKSGDSSLLPSFRFDLRHFCEQMDEVLKELNAISCAIAGAYDQMTGTE